MRAAVALPICWVLSGCTALQPREEPEAEQGLEVVDDEGSFDPSEAVDDMESIGEAIQPQAAAVREDETQPSEVAAERKEQRQEVEGLAAEGDAASKVAAASNPPPRQPGLPEGISWSLLDLALEGLLLLVLAVPLTALTRLAFRFPRVAAGVTLAGGLGVGCLGAFGS